MMLDTLPLVLDVVPEDVCAWPPWPLEAWTRGEGAPISRPMTLEVATGFSRGVLAMLLVDTA